MWQRFSERARRVIFCAQEEAGRLGSENVSTEHILLGLIDDKISPAIRILNRMGISPEVIRSEIEKQVTRVDAKTERDIQLTPRAKRVIDLAYDEARQLSNAYVCSEHLLLGLIREGEGLAGRVLAKLGVDLERTRREAMALQDADFSQTPAAPSRPRALAIHIRFAEEFVKLSPRQQAALTGDGLALNALPDTMQDMIHSIFDAEVFRNRSVRDKRFFLSPNSLVRVAVTQVDGGTHYTVTTSASVFIDFLAREV